MAGKPRKNDRAEARRTVKATVLLDVETHQKLAALAALRGCDRSTIAAEAIRAAVSSVVVFDRAARFTAKVDPTHEGIGGDEAA